MMDIGAFLLFCIPATWTPGPNPLVCMSHANAYGFRRTLPLLGGIYSSFILVMVLCLLLGQAMMGLSFLFPVMRGVGVVYLLYLAWKNFTRGKVGSVEAKPMGYVQGFMLQFINPKVILYGLLAATRFVLPAMGAKWEIFPYAVFLASVPMVANLLWSLAGSGLRVVFNRHYQLMNTLMALLLVYAAYRIGRG